MNLLHLKFPRLLGGSIQLETRRFTVINGVGQRFVFAFPWAKWGQK